MCFKFHDGMNTANPGNEQWNQRCNAPGATPEDTAAMFRLLFERSTDPIWLFDPVAGVFVDCNEAAVSLIGCGTKEQLLKSSPAELAPPVQPDGRESKVVAREITALVERDGGHRFEWTGRRANGEDVPAGGRRDFHLREGTTASFRRVARCLRAQAGGGGAAG